MVPRYLVVASSKDPVAEEVWKRFGPLPSVGLAVEGIEIRALSEDVWALHRPGLHIFDERLDSRLPAPLREQRVPLVFPSIHRSDQGVACLTVHPLGNPGLVAEVGGFPGALTPTSPRLMTGALRGLAEAAPAAGLTATFEATHHGPLLDHPAFFVEIGYGELPRPPEAAVQVLSKLLPELRESANDRIAIGVGGGHYVPHFTQLALGRSWSFGHLLSRHALVDLSETVARDAVEKTPGANGILFARAEDAQAKVWQGIAPRLRDSQAPRRLPAEATGLVRNSTTSGASPASET